MLRLVVTFADLAQTLNATEANLAVRECEMSVS